MRKIASIVAGALVAGALVAPSSSAASKQQVVEGTILFPAVFAQGTFDGCWGGLTRRVTQTAAGHGSGVFGYRFPVEKSTWNKPFVLEATGGQGTIDLDLFLYQVMPGAEAVADDPVNGGTPVSVDFNTRGEGGEAGIVPKGTTDAIVCLYSGPDHQGFDASFKYTAGKGVKLPK